MTRTAPPPLSSTARTPRWPPTVQAIPYASVGASPTTAAGAPEATARAFGPPPAGSQENIRGAVSATPSRRSSEKPFQIPYSSSAYPVGANTAAGARPSWTKSSYAIVL